MIRQSWELEEIATGGKARLARFLTAMEVDADNPAVARVLDAALASPKGTVVGLTGPPGVGKSTLTNALIPHLRAEGARVAVIAIDPSSRSSGGALLGDRARVEVDPGDEAVFIRSMAARDRLGGVSDLTYPTTVVMRALFDMVLVETVGVGQSEGEIADCADLVVLCVQPGSGDSLQFMKAGIMEIPDLILVTKGDMGAPAIRAESDLKGALGLANHRGVQPAVLKVSAQSGEGLAETVSALAGLRSALDADGSLNRDRNRQIRQWAESFVRQHFGTEGAAALVEEQGLEIDSFTSLQGLTEHLRQSIRSALYSAEKQ